MRIRLRSDVKIGSALSGGLDSSTITFLINQNQKKCVDDKLETFSSVYKSDGVQHCDESHFVNQLAEYLNVKSNQIEPLISDVRKEYEKMIYSMDNPPAGPNMGGWFTFKLISSTNVKINLDGQGADEQLAGYYSYLWRHVTNLTFYQIISECKKIFLLPEISKKNLIISIMLNLLRDVLSLKNYA